jgi:hypothetical protein
MGDLVFMKKQQGGGSPRSPRVRAHPLKQVSNASNSNLSNSMPIVKTKKSKKKAPKNQGYYNPPPMMPMEDYLYNDDERSYVMDQMQMDDADEVGTYRSLDAPSVHSVYSAQRSVSQLMQVIPL